MTPYTIYISASAEADIIALARFQRRPIRSRINRLKGQPIPNMVYRLTIPNCYAVTYVGYNILYEVDDRQNALFILRIMPITTSSLSN